MADPTLRMLPNTVHFREFQNDPVTGHHYTATCGKTALAAAMVCASPKIESAQDAINLMTSMTREMMALKWADSPNGATTTAHLEEEAVTKRGFQRDDFISYEEPLPSDALHKVLLAKAGIEPIVLEVARAYNLHSLNGGSDEAGVQYHFICIVGICSQGYYVMDGDNADIEAHLVLYSWTTLEAAVPCGLLVLKMQEAPVATPVPATKGVPTGWKDDGTNLVAPNGVAVVKGFRDWVLAHPWDAKNTPMAVEQHISGRSIEPGNPAVGPGARQDFRFCSLGWTQAWNVYVIAVGQDLVAVEKSLDAANAALASAQTLIAQLQAKLNQPAPVPMTQKQKDELAALDALVAALKEGSVA
jgi:hypothetical protein